jgi:hypothetical protein
MKPQERIRTALQKAQSIVARYIHPGRRNCQETVNDLAEVLDDEKVVLAMKETEQSTPSAERENNVGAEGWEPAERVAKKASQRS